MGWFEKNLVPKDKAMKNDCIDNSEHSPGTWKLLLNDDNNSYDGDQVQACSKCNKILKVTNLPEPEEQE